MILKGISVNQNPPTKDYLWITPKGNTRFWNQSTWMLIGGNGGGGSGNLPKIESAGKYLVTTETAGNYSLAWGDINLSSYINGTSGYAAVFNSNNSIISAIGNNSKMRIGDGIIEWDSTNNGFKIYNATSTQETPTTAGIYADWVSALGPNSSGGGGGGSDLDWGSLITWDEDPTHIINIDYLPVSLNNGVITIGNNSITPVTSVAMTVPTGFTINGSPITKTGTLALGYNNGYEGFTTDLKNKINDLYSWFEVDNNGNVKTKDKPNNGGHRGFYSESFISALGLNSSGGGGGGGISETDLWIELTNNSGWLTTDPKIIARDHIPINGASGNSGGQTFFAPINGGSVGQFLISNGNSAPSWHTLAASDIPNLSASKINSGTFDAARIPTLSITDKTSGTLPITRGGTGRTTSPTITVNLSSTSTGTSLLPSSGNVSTGISGTLAIANGGTGATTAKGAEYNILSEASTALETDFDNTTRFAIEHTNPSATNGVLVGYRTASQLWSYIKGKMSSDSAVNISGNAATATVATKLGTSSFGNKIKPFYLNAGVPTTCDIYKYHYDSTSDYASYAWHKVAYAAAYANTDKVVSFYVTTGNSTTINGVLKCRVRWDADATSINSSGTKLTWVVNNGIDVNDFVFVWKSPNIELWCKIPARYGGYQFTVLDSGNRAGNGILTWTMCDSNSAHGSASYTSGGTVIISTNATLTNNISGTVNGYSIASTINDGTTNRLAYYSDANVIDDATYIGCDGTRLCVGGNVDTNYAFKVTNGRSYTDFYPAADFGSNAIGFNARCRYNPSGLNGSNNFEAVGLLGQYIGSANNTNIDCYGIKGLANNDGTYHINGKCIGIQGNALKGNTNYGVQASLFVDTSSTTNRGFTTYLSGTPASNSTNMGINVENLFSAGTNYGIKALVSGATSNTNYAVYASATNGTNNWGIYSYRGKNYFYDSVGIGTISPAYKLDINGNVHTNSDFYLDNTKKIYLGNNASTTVYQDVMRLDSSNNFIIGNGTSASNYNTYLDGFKIYLRTNTGHSTRLYINEDGNVGIGNTSPNTKLHVSGNIYATGGVTALQAVSSDKRLKKNIKKFNAKDIVDKLNPVSFEWNSKAKKLSDFKDGTNYGLIAQDSDGIIDNLVFDLPNGKGYKGVRYEKLIPILLQAVKEQQKEIDELKQIIKKLKV